MWGLQSVLLLFFGSLYPSIPAVENVLVIDVTVPFHTFGGGGGGGDGDLSVGGRGVSISISSCVEREGGCGVSGCGVSGFAVEVVVGAEGAGAGGTVE